jgi:hypothetical protein
VTPSHFPGNEPWSLKDSVYPICIFLVEKKKKKLGSYFMWDICMLKSVSEAWIFLMTIIVIFLHNMLRLVVGHLLIPTTLTIFTHINHVHIAQILIIVLVIVHPED